ncbi:GNAT family N-acetyltransferase [Francisella tularensis]|uniref:GNAT family N-acetyltransferase n=1 Tax=Francisella tularensis TaxID=263 RepID=UPI000185545E|nr:N-acetyltransferase [Francisella tularensis]APA82175.1 Acetyltransferase [Francisella tularensis subsp. novicida PA10-7858]APC96141.1 acetyltransferase domain protein [Francisella tularensis subsp. novicida]AVC43334.1 N-acetyltransferase [Francisella tularensis subsp. novicida]EDZ90267.1 acetyltransferase, gnat family [Francisella tularensis subsp. novicida FTG]MBK2334813.1 GNAT family N-acetyltransferase [Francisella tularensis subsp. novicida]
MQISKAQLTDLQALIDLENTTFLSDKISKKQFAYNINKQKYFFVAKIQGSLAGYILCFEYKKTIRVYSLAVSKNYQGQGIGKKLLEYILNNTDKNISLEVNTNNLIAISLYQKLGFEINKQINNYYENSDAAYKMTLIRKI